MLRVGDNIFYFNSNQKSKYIRRICQKITIKQEQS